MSAFARLSSELPGDQTGRMLRIPSDATVCMLHPHGVHIAHLCIASAVVRGRLFERLGLL